MTELIAEVLVRIPVLAGLGTDFQHLLATGFTIGRQLVMIPKSASKEVSTPRSQSARLARLSSVMTEVT